ncbi:MULTISPECIES: DUF3320 domain-containing protein [unclassified Adlercreutzia]|uniref:DUF3320 domain-containing protein n=1 Tax=unclassified Adlercreutzia TaxID=2636013 RepID=UPI0013ED9D5A|nr:MULTISPECIES: DUF3320 domain-containing protein [unclassified Adlercreutzia]
MGDRFEVSELEDVLELLELVEEGSGKAIVTMGGTERFVVMTAERYRALSDGYRREKERAEEANERIRAAQTEIENAHAQVARANSRADAAEAAHTVQVSAENTAAHVAQTFSPAQNLGGNAKEYKTAKLPNTPIDSDDYQRSMWQEAIVERMRKVIEAEAPVEKQRLFNTVRASFGIKRSGRDIQSHNEWLFNRKINAKQTEFNGCTFVWRGDQDPKTYCIFRPTDEESNRQITEYPYQELVAAILAALKSQEKLTYEDLIEATMRLLGYKRKTNRVREVIGAAIEQAGENGTIRVFTDGTFRVV